MKLLSFLLFAGLACGQTKVTSVEGITEYKIDNGLRVLLFPDATKPTFTVNVTYMVGSRHEGYGETGMAHLLEHMVFKGTSKRGDIKQELRNHGANYNGSTSFDRTNYFETMQATDENLRYALEMEADRMVNSLIRKSDLDSEMTVVRSEFEMGENSPQSVLMGRTLATAFLWHGYGRLPIGARSDIENVPIERLQAFYRRYYQPDNALLVVAGKFDEPKTLGWIKQYFGAIPQSSGARIPTYTEEPVQDGERVITLRRVGDVQAVMALYHIPAGPHPDFAAIDLLTAVLGEVPAGRLYKALVENKKATSANGFTFQLREPGVAIFTAQARKEQALDETISAMTATLDAVSKEPPSKDEVERARTRLLKQIELNLNNSEAVCVDLSEWASMGDWRLLFLHRDRVKKVTPEDVARVAKAYFKPSNRTVGRFLPEAQPDRAEIPRTTDVGGMLKDFKGGAAVEAGEVFDPSPANIEGRTLRAQLPNGMKLAMLPKRTRGATVHALIAIDFGDEKSLFGRSAAAQLTGSMLMRGTKNRTRQQIQDELDKLKAQVSVTGTATSATASIQTTRENLAGALRIVAEVLREPAFPEKEFDQLRQASLAGAEAGRSEPQQIAIRAFNRHIFPYPSGDIRSVMTFDEQIGTLKKITLEDLKKFYTDFYGASNAEVGIVGDFDATAIGKLMGELFGSWRSPAKFAEVKRSWQKLATKTEMIETPDKANAMFVAGLTTKITDDDPDYPAMLLANSMIGGGAQSRLYKRIRDKEGLSYVVQSEFQAGVKEDAGVFVALAICAPQNMNKLEATFKEEMQKLAKDGFDAEELKVAKAAWMQQRQIQRSQDVALARRLAGNERYGRNMMRDADIEAKVAALTPDAINAVVRRHVNPDSFSYFKAGDFKKAGITQ
jgi:zinc protease